MKTISIANTDEYLYLETLNNGAKVYMYPMKERTHFTCFLGTYFGGEDTTFFVNDEKKQVPSGIAHFLEHKMFDQEINPSGFYAKSGTDVNAQTTSDYTGYYFSGNQNFEENLKFLLNWVKNFKITKESVEKERGIILEEARMYEDNSNRIIHEVLNKNLFIHHPSKQKVIGSYEDIKKISLEDLCLCYNSFYRPDQLFFIIIGNFDMDETIKIIQEEWKDYHNPKTLVKKQEVSEEDKVFLEYEKINMPIEEKKIGIGYKINKNKFKELNLTSYELSYYIGMILSLGFGDTSDFYENILKDQIAYSFQKRFFEIPSHFIIEFITRTKDKDNFYKYFNENLTNIVLKEEDFERVKKLWIATEVRTLDSIQGMMYTILDDLLMEKEFNPNHITDIKNLKFDTLLKVLNNISWDNKTILEIEK